MSDDEHARAEALAEAMCARLSRLSPFTQDREHIARLRPELATMLDVLLESPPPLAALPTAPSLKEPLALLNLLARRFAEVGVTPGVALLLPDVLTTELRAAGWEVAETLRTSLIEVVAEAFLRAREERARDETVAAFAKAIQVTLLAPRCLTMVIGGPLAAEQVRDAVEELGRALLRNDARAAVIDVERLSDPTPAVAAELFAARDVGATVGAKIVFAAPSSALLEAARASRVAVDTLDTAPTYGEALRSALLAAGLVLRPRSMLRALVGAD